MFIENKLKFCPYIVEAVVLGHERDYVTAMICIDYKHVGKWAEEHRINYTTYSDLAAKPEVIRSDRAGGGCGSTPRLPEKARIRKFLLLYKELDPDDEELTRTKKIRRGFINQKYAKEIEALYGDRGHVAHRDRDPLPGRQDGHTADRPRSSAHHETGRAYEQTAAKKKRFCGSGSKGGM